MIFDFIEKFKGLFADKSKYGDQHISMGRKQEYLRANNTIAVGYEVDADGNYSTALGTGTEVNYENQVVIGKYNIKRNSDYAFIIGNGTNDNNRSNALEVSWNGNLDVYRDLYVNGWIQSTKGIQSDQSIQSAIDVTCTGEGGVGTVSMRALNNNLANISNYNISSIPILVGKVGSFNVYRVSYDITPNNDDIEKQIDIVCSGRQVLKIDGIAYYDNSTACIPLGQYNENFKCICGVTSSKKLYLICHSNNRINLVRVYIDYMISN